MKWSGRESREPVIQAPNETERLGSTRPFACYRLDVASGSHDQIEDRSEFDDAWSGSR